MRKKVNPVPPPEVMLTRVLEGLEPDLIEATDEDIAQAARGLGMNLSMKGSAAWLGLKGPARPSFSEFFGHGPFSYLPQDPKGGDGGDADDM